MTLKKELTMKAAAEIFKLASRINIKPKDIIGMGGDIVKMGKSLFNTKVNPELTSFISKKGEIPTNVMENIKIHLRSLKNASGNQVELFKLNLKDIVNAKHPPKANILDIKSGLKLPAAGIKQLETSVGYPKNVHPQSTLGKAIDESRTIASDMAKVESQMGNIKKTSSKLDDAIKGYENVFKPRGPKFGTKEYYLNELKNTYPKHYQRLTGKETTAELKEIVYRLDIEGVPFAKGGIATHFRKK